MTALPANSGHEPVEAAYVSSDLAVRDATTSGKTKTNKASVQGKHCAEFQTSNPFSSTCTIFKTSFPFSAIPSGQVFAALMHVDGLS